MDFIQSLTESKLFASKTSFAHRSGRELAELAYLHIIALRIMSCEKITHMQSKQYALKTNNHDDFKKWKSNGTDLYLILHALKGDVKAKDDTSEHYIKTLSLDIPKITAWLLSISSHNSDSDTKAHRLFASMDSQFKINDGSYRSIRRLAMNWPDLNKRERQLCFTRLIQIMRVRCKSSDTFEWLEKLSRNNGLELQDACDKETDDCGNKDTTLARAAQHATSIYEDGDAAPAPAGTTTADIAPFVKPLGKVRRRNPK
jgi:hypothetical protein